MSLRRFLFFLSLLSFTISCGRTVHTTPIESSKLDPIVPSKDPCDISGSHSIFSILVDGADVGREVRTDILENGSSGQERFIFSHSVKNVKMGKVLFQTIHVRTERSVSSSGKILATSFVKKDQVSTESIDISYNDNHYIRTISSISDFKSRNSASSDTIDISGSEYLGYRILDTARDISFGKVSPPQNYSYFDAKLNAPVFLSFSSPNPSTIEIDGQDIVGHFVDVSSKVNGNIIAQYFFDSSGLLWIEKYPDLHEERVRIVGSFSLPSDTSELIVGLHSNAYIYDPNIATRATYHLSSTPDRLNSLSLLEEPLNQSIDRLSDSLLELTVHSGAPDQNVPPSEADLGSSFYIRPDDPKIKDALLFLKTAGKKGNLIEIRRLNATPVIARASIIRKTRSFWSDNNKVAGIMMQYVSSLLPDKRHTFSMSDAVSTLEKGAGDCTEHAVLFASLMRSHGIPTRLVTGMLLTPGGMWAYHMWNAYWDGESWQSIDPSTKTYRPGALYVSLGRGASVFNDIRDRLADFMWRTFSGVSFDLIEAANEGETLSLARPVNVAEKSRSETSLFNAVVLSDRGDHLGALTLLDHNIPESSRSLSVKLMRIELLIKSERYDIALKNISSLRRETSAPENTSLLDLFEFQSSLYLGNFKLAGDLLEKLSSRKDFLDDTKKTLLNAEYLFASGKETESISLVEKALKSSDSESEHFIDLLKAYSGYISKSDSSDLSLLKKAYFSSVHSLKSSHFIDPESISTFSLLLFRMGRPAFASWYLDHALTLAPKDKNLQQFYHRLSSDLNCPAVDYQ